MNSAREEGKMKDLRWYVVALLLFLAVVLLFAPLELGGEFSFQVQPIVYLLLAAAIASNIFIPYIQRFSAIKIIIGWLAVYLIARLTIFTQPPVLGGISTYRDLVILGVSVFLSYQLANRLNDLEQVIEKLTLPTLDGKVFALNEATDEIKTEFVRSRRHNRPLSVVVVEPIMDMVETDFQRTVKEIQEAMVDRYVSANLAQVITKEVRRTDLVMEERVHQHNRFIVLCPETPSEGSYILAERIKSNAKQSLGIPIVCGIASFPNEALTFEDLVQKAEANLTDASTLALDAGANSLQTDAVVNK